MKRAALIMAVWLCGAGLAGAELEWRQVSEGISDVRCAFVNEKDAVIYLSSGKRALKSLDAGASWRGLVNFKAVVNHLLMREGVFLAATDDGVYKSANKGSSWIRAFRGQNSAENKCYVLVYAGPKLYLVTAKGVFSSSDNAESWQSEPGFLDGLARVEAGWEQNEDSSYTPLALAIDPADPKHIVFSDSRGIRGSLDGGASWNELSEYGLLERRVDFLYYSASNGLYALNSSGIFNFRNGRWHEISLGLSAGKIYSICDDAAGNIYAATDTGLFKSYVDSAQKVRVLDNINEPSIAQVQDIAIKYAEVAPEKIIAWRKLAAKKAILPELSIGANNNTTDVWHWETGSTAKGDDDTLRRGKSIVEWDVTLSWDLGDLIWSEAQTSIDVRSKLMVELREDILDRVNKYYFERLRVKAEMNNLTLEDRRRQVEKEIRVQELTASLDALTGGYFSQHCR